MGISSIYQITGTALNSHSKHLDMIAQNMANQRRGLRDGVGFYDFRETDVAAYRLERMVSFVELLRHLRLLPAPLLAGRRARRTEG